jgi:hypothetical protein
MQVNNTGFVNRDYDPAMMSAGLNEIFIKA